MPDAVDLARRTDVELIRTGSWSASSGSWNPTRADILAAVEAQKCPAVRRPRIKLGHTDERFNGDGEPALGWFENLRTGDGGHTLVGDQVALPWLNQVQAAAYPDRSIEGAYRYRCGLGHEHPFVLTAVALLGVTPPAVSTLKSVQDLPDMLGVAAAEDVPEDAQRVAVTVHAADTRPGDGNAKQLERYWTESPEGLAKWRDDPHPWTALYHHLLKYLPDDEAKRTAASWYHKVFGHWPGAKPGVHAAEGEDAPPMSRAQQIRDAWNARMPYEQWIQEVRANEVIVVDDTDRSYQRRTVQVLAEDDVVFGPAEPYDPAADKVLVYASRAESRPEPESPAAPSTAGAGFEIKVNAAPNGGTILDAVRGAIRANYSPNLPAAEPEPENTDPKEDPVSTDLSAFRSRLGLDDTADEQAILSALDALKVKAETSVEPTPEMVAASAAAETEKDELRKEVTVLASQVQTMSSKLATAEAEKAATVKASVLAEAKRLGKFTPADEEQWAKDYDEAPGAITRVLASIAPGTAVPVMASGTAGSPEPTMPGFSDDELTDAFFGPGSAARFNSQEA